MRSGGGVGTRSIGVLAVVLATASCSSGSEDANAMPAATGEATGSLASDVISGTALGDGTFDVSSFELSVRHESATTAVEAEVRAKANRTLQRVAFDYCGPPLLFLSVDGSTVEATITDRKVTAELDAPLGEGVEFGLRFLAVIPREQTPPGLSAPDVAAQLLCR